MKKLLVRLLLAVAVVAILIAAAEAGWSFLRGKTPWVAHTYAQVEAVANPLAERALFWLGALGPLLALGVLGLFLIVLGINWRYSRR